MADGDEYLVGIQAEHILQGEHPMYYYGQPYMGSVEAYLVALVFKVMGTSSWALRATTTLLCLVLVSLTWRLAGALADVARLPAYARRWFQTVAGLFAALPPLYDTIVEMRTWGGHIEIYILSLWLLLSAVRLTQRWKKGASGLEMGLRWLIIGFIIGFGIYIYPIISYAILTAVVWIAGYLMMSITRTFHHLPFSDEPALPITIHIRNLALVLVAIPGALLGFSPSLYYGIKHNWVNIAYLTAPGSDGGGDVAFHTAYSTSTILQGRASYYMNCISPQVIGGSMHTESVTHASPVTFAILITLGIACIAIVGLLLLASLVIKQRLLWQIQKMSVLPCIFALTTILIFIFSNAVGYSIFKPCIHDGVGRYAAPVVLVLPFFMAALITFTRMLIEQRSMQQSTSKMASLTSNSSAYIYTDRKKYSPTFKIAQGVLAGFVLCYLCLQGYSYLKSDANYTFQSFNCLLAPVNPTPMINYMQQEHITRVWSTPSFGNAITFKTDGKIIAVNPRTVAFGTINRIPEYTTIVAHASFVSLIDQVPHGDPTSLLLTYLNKAHVKYRVARFQTQPGNQDMLVVTPLSRTLTPKEATLENYC
ncbi:hypothetical protein [Dictyobacter arantiisoli]|uniref:Glycosyltransferase RgtA/B/C/D-like domain-containing protein n=1 Tax=Dictyobacter arantiisoli TaxID=2014874 RepID=A0A5A5TGW0_9CHLR|nr:hypothetical protein [Dictyobacter arantiisoli]GCF10448.1 hypothetical protein KDI_40120 [Dictyobacter arantiisoli]